MQHLIDKINSLRQSHYTCDDCWYSCPKSNGEDEYNYCGPEDVTVCICGADQHNKIIDEIVAEVKCLTRIDEP